ncbi:MAG: diacylglyceryl transferase [Proteobacteria bacterium]|nr:diacylglyceryl transferase [Pseudomonadota bacterium]
MAQGSIPHLFPVIFHIGPITLEAHLLCEILAYFAGLQYYQHLRHRRGDVIGDHKRLWVMIGGIFGAAVGSKLLGLLEHPELLSLSLSRQHIAYLFTSKTIVGGLLGGLLGVEATKKLLGVTRSTGDLFCFPILLGMMIGRMGCFLAGVDDGTWGNETHGFSGIDGGDGVPRHPLPLYELLVLGATWLSLARLRRRVALREGGLFKLFMVSYLLWRFGAEFLKPSYAVGPTGLSAIQIACLLGLLYYYKVILKFRSLLA